MYMKIIRSALVAHASKVLGRLQATDNLCEIRALARELACTCKLLDHIDNGAPL